MNSGTCWEPAKNADEPEVNVRAALEKFASKGIVAPDDPTGEAWDFDDAKNKSRLPGLHALYQ